jgi:hypothetical protein
MRRSSEYKESCRLRGIASQRASQNKRLAHAVDCRPTESYLVLEIGVHNPRTGIYNYMEIRHEMKDGNNRNTVYLNGVRWNKAFSRSGFCRWLFNKIDPVLSDWD